MGRRGGTATALVIRDQLLLNAQTERETENPPELQHAIIDHADDLIRLQNERSVTPTAVGFAHCASATMPHVNFIAPYFVACAGALGSQSPLRTPPACITIIKQLKPHQLTLGR